LLDPLEVYFQVPEILISGTVDRPTVTLNGNQTQS